MTMLGSMNRWSVLCKWYVLAILVLVSPTAWAAPTVTVTASSVTILGTSQTISLVCTLVDPNQTGVLRTGGTVVTKFSASTTTPGSTATCGPIYGNDVITDGFGNASTSYYLIGVYTVTSGIVASTPVLLQAYQFAGSGTFDLSSTLPYALGAVSPAGSMLGQNLTFTGANSHSGAETFNSFNSVLWAGPGSTPTCDAQVTALGANPGTVMISSGYTGPECAALSYNAVDGSNYNIYRGSNNITIHDLRASTNKAYGINYGGITLASQARLAVTQSVTTPSTTTSAILGTNQVTGNIGAAGGALAGITAEVDVEGPISGVSGNIVQALAGQWAVRSTGGTLPIVTGVEGGGGMDRASGVGGTNITTAVSVQGDAVSANLSTGTIQDTFGVRGLQSTAGTRNNFAIVSEGDMMFKDNACIYGENGSVAALKLICYGIDSVGTGGANIYPTTNSPAAWKYIVNGGHYNWLAGPQVNLSNIFEITPSTATNGTTFSFPAFSISAGGILGLANGTANQYLFTPSAPGASRIVNISDPTVTVSLPLFGGIGAGHIQAKRASGCATAASLAATCPTVVTWTTSFADTNYTASCTGDVITSGVPLNGGLTAKTNGSVTFQTVSATAAAAQYTTIDCTAVHD